MALSKKAHDNARKLYDLRMGTLAFFMETPHLINVIATEKRWDMN